MNKIYKKEALLDIIKHKGICARLPCDSNLCPIFKDCISGWYEKNYNSAVKAFVKEFGPEDLVEMLL